MVSHIFLNAHTLKDYKTEKRFEISKLNQKFWASEV